MLIGAELAPARLVLLVVIAVVATAASLRISNLARWPPAGPLALLAATPFVPSLPVAYGISTDDVVPAVGTILCLLVVDWGRLRRSTWPVALVAGMALMAAAGLIASVANAATPSDAITMVLKSVGRLVFLGMIATVVSLTVPEHRRRVFVACSVVIVATAEAAFGLIAWLIPLPDGAGLEASRQMTSLLGVVPGRIAGTTGLSPNFLGALFVLSLPLAVALAVRSLDRRFRVLWWAAVGLQLLALTLTFTRTSLVIAVATLVVLLLSRGHARMLAVAAVLVGVVALATPLGVRLIGDANDRAALWTSAVRMMMDQPVTGVGPGRMLVVAAANPDRYRLTNYGVATNNAHNTILLAGAETGIVGAAGALLVNLSIAGAAFVTLAAIAAPSRRSPGIERVSTDDLEAAAALGVLGFLVQGMTNNLFTVRVTSVMVVLILSAFLIPPPIRMRRAARIVRLRLHRLVVGARSPSGP